MGAPNGLPDEGHLLGLWPGNIQVCSGQARGGHTSGVPIWLNQSPHPAQGLMDGHEARSLWKPGSQVPPPGQGSSIGSWRRPHLPVRVPPSAWTEPSVLFIYFLLAWFPPESVFPGDAITARLLSLGGRGHAVEGTQSLGLSGPGAGPPRLRLPRQGGAVGWACLRWGLRTQPVLLHLLRRWL